MEQQVFTGDITMIRIAKTYRGSVGGRARRSLECTSVFGALLLGVAASAAHAQSQPPSLDDQLRVQLALGNADGCASLLGVPPGDQQGVADELKRLSDLGQIGNELRAICGPSAVASASSLGGSLDTVQATKTVSQFRLARRRIDQRLPRRGGRKQRQALMLMLQPGPHTELSIDAARGYGIFGELDYEQRKRDITRYEDGYDGHVSSGSLGIDFAWDRGVAGIWGGYSKTNADFRGAGPQAFTTFDDSPDDSFDRLLSDPTVSSSICGGVVPGGDFGLEGGTLGAFVAWKFDKTGFLDISASRSEKDYAYSRNTCVIEAQDTASLVFDGTVLFNDGNGNGVFDSDQDNRVDDIFAGTISGDTRATEDSLSIRAGFDKDAGDWSFGPRATVYYLRTRVDDYEETGSSTVANTVEPNAGDPVTRMLGGPLGLELAYEDRDDDTTLLELGGLVERHFETGNGMLIAHASAYWRHQFDDSRRFTTVRFVQDRRPDPARFSFASNEVDPDNALFSLGVTALFGERTAVRLEVTHLAFDRLVDSTAVSAQFRIGL